MKRILVMASTFPRWEGDTLPPFVYELSERLAQMDYEIHVLAPHAKDAAARENLGSLYVHRFRYAPESLETLAYGGGILENLRGNPFRWGLVPAFFASQLFSTWWLNRRLKFDLIHAHWFIPQGITSAVLPSWITTPKLLTAHGGDVFASKTGLKKHLVRFVADRHDAITVNSTAMGDAVMELTGKRSTTIPMGVDLRSFSGTPQLQAGDRHQEARILFVGRLAEKKGVEYLLRAMPGIRDAILEAKLTVVGDGPRLSALQDEASSLGIGDAVTFTGAVPNSDLPGYYREADVFVAPSVIAESGDTEALGVVLLEAAGCGLPIVASRVGGILDVIKDRETGLLVDEKSPEQIGLRVVELLQNRELASRLGSAALSYMNSNYSWDSVAARFAYIYQQLIDGRRVEIEDLSIEGEAA